MSKIKNLKQFLAWRGFGEDEAGYWARCFYKYTDCGPWAVFLMKGEDQGEEAREEEFSFTVSIQQDGKLGVESEALPPDDLLSRFGFNQEGKLKKDYRSDSCMRSMDAYWKALVEYRKKLDKSDRFEIDSMLRPRAWRRPFCKKWIHITLKRHVTARPPVADEIYYEDIGPKYAWREFDCCCTTTEVPMEDDPQGYHYVSKDPDPKCEECGGSGKVRHWMKTGEEVKVDPDLCIGIKFGSIVEGSECCSGPYEHFFPFKKKDFDRDIEHMEAETSYYWERDNSQWYEVRVTGGNDYWVHNTWGDIRWDGEPPYKQLREKIERFIEENWESIPHIPGYWGDGKPDWQPLKIPGTRATIHEYCNDGIF